MRYTPLQTLGLWLVFLLAASSQAAQPSSILYIQAASEQDVARVEATLGQATLSAKSVGASLDLATVFAGNDTLAERLSAAGIYVYAIGDSRPAAYADACEEVDMLQGPSDSIEAAVEARLEEHADYYPEDAMALLLDATSRKEIDLGATLDSILTSFSRYGFRGDLYVVIVNEVGAETQLWIEPPPKLSVSTIPEQNLEDWLSSQLSTAALETP